MNVAKKLQKPAGREAGSKSVKKLPEDLVLCAWCDSREGRTNTIRYKESGKVVPFDELSRRAIDPDSTFKSHGMCKSCERDLRAELEERKRRMLNNQKPDSEGPRF